MKKIPLTQGQFALVDDDDFELVSRYKWYAKWDKKTKSFRPCTAIRNTDGKQQTVLMYRLVMNAKPGEMVDHIHHDTLDSRKSELRLCTNSQNMMNTGKPSKNSSGHKGVSKTGQKWRARIRIDSNQIHLGYYTDINDAIAARAAAVNLYHKEFGVS